MTALGVSGVAHAEEEAAAAPAAVPGRLFVVQKPTPLKFKVPTNVGEVAGTIDVTRLEARGIEGWGRFEIRVTVDPASVDTGDSVRDRHIARWVLRGEEGTVRLGATPTALEEGRGDRRGQAQVAPRGLGLDG